MSTRDHRQVVVLGGGLAGLAASSRLHERAVDVLVLERESRPGGLARSFQAEGFTFDQGPHISFTRREEIRDLLARAVAGRYHDSAAVLLNAWRGLLLRHPVQSHLHGLPVDLVERCILGIAAANGRAPGPASTYEDWCLAHLGRPFSEEFTFRYTRKYWTAEARQLTADWVGTRVHAPTLEEVVRGALSPQPANQHYLTRYRYPAQGGFEPYVQGVLRGQPIALGEEVVSVDPARREVLLASGRAVGYEVLVSSLPLPVLVERAEGAPEDVRRAAADLRCTELAIVSVGLAREAGLPEADWMYFYDEDLPFARAHFPRRLALANVPSGCASVQVELYGSPYRPLPAGPLQEEALRGLRRAGLLGPDEAPMVVEERRLPFANVLFDHGRAEALVTVRTWLAAAGIECCGRFGEWDYFWSDDAITSGWRAAERVLGRLAGAGPASRAQPGN